jgi:hypothetical protein
MFPTISSVANANDRLRVCLQSARAFTYRKCSEQLKDSCLGCFGHKRYISWNYEYFDHYRCVWPIRAPLFPRKKENIKSCTIHLGYHQTLIQLNCFVLRILSAMLDLHLMETRPSSPHAVRSTEHSICTSRTSPSPKNVQSGRRIRSVGC